MDALVSAVATSHAKAVASSVAACGQTCFNLTVYVQSHNLNCFIC